MRVSRAELEIIANNTIFQLIKPLMLTQSAPVKGSELFSSTDKNEQDAVSIMCKRYAAIFQRNRSFSMEFQKNIVVSIQSVPGYSSYSLLSSCLFLFFLTLQVILCEIFNFSYQTICVQIKYEIYLTDCSLFTDLIHTRRTHLCKERHDSIQEKGSMEFNNKNFADIARRFG